VAAVYAEQGRVDEARTKLDEAITILRDAGDRVHEGIFLAQLGAARARLDDIEGAARALDAAATMLKPNRDDPLFASLEAQRAFLGLAESRRAARAGDARRAGELRAEVVSVADRLASPGVSFSDDVRVAVRMLRAELARADGVAIPMSTRAALVIADDARDVRAPSGAVLSLAQRRAPRLILLRLVEERDRAPGHPLTVDQLLEAGWPGERVLPDAGASRVYVALGTLRKLGLREVILSRDGGYLLDPRVPVLRVPEL
jgi:tetratricopeptide (TPR) repeat protein